MEIQYNAIPSVFISIPRWMPLITAAETIQERSRNENRGLWKWEYNISKLKFRSQDYYCSCLRIHCSSLY